MLSRAHKKRSCRVVTLVTSVTAAFLLSIQPASSASESIEELKSFSENLKSFQTGFEQTVYDAQSQPVQSSTGSASLKRPGKFTWHYKEPNEQQIVSDGEQVWIYDLDLEQVTVSTLGDRAAGTPLALLMAESPLEEEFDIKGLGEKDSISWYELKPKSKENDFETIFLGLNAKGLAVMELRDNFGQATQIKFTDFEINVPLKDVQFKFTPPSGVDVIGEG